MFHCYQSLVPLFDNKKGKQDIQSLLFQLVVSVACHQFLIQKHSLLSGLSAFRSQMIILSFLFLFRMFYNFFSPQVSNLQSLIRHKQPWIRVKTQGENRKMHSTGPLNKHLISKRNAILLCNLNSLQLPRLFFFGFDFIKDKSNSTTPTKNWTPAYMYKRKLAVINFDVIKYFPIRLMCILNHTVIGKTSRKGRWSFWSIQNSFYV